MMQFDDMKKIWDAQNNRPMYAIDENTLHRRVQARTSGLRYGTNITEWTLVFIYIFTSTVLLVTNRFKTGTNLFLYLGAAAMLALVVFILVGRHRRVVAGRRFDRSLYGDLDHAISLFRYQMQLSRMLQWSFLPVGLIMILSGWANGKLLQVGLTIVISNTLAFFVTGAGYRASRRRKRELEQLKTKLESEV